MQSKYGFNTTTARSELMKKIKSTDTKPEIYLRKNLWALGYRYRLNVKGLPGKPDIVFRKKKLAIFIDGEFWHGYKWKEKKEKIRANRYYWIPKIERNIKRDLENNRKLRQNGWVVLRFWEHQINKNFESVIKKILYSINSNSN